MPMVQVARLKQSGKPYEHLLQAQNSQNERLELRSRVFHNTLWLFNVAMGNHNF